MKHGFPALLVTGLVVTGLTSVSCGRKTPDVAKADAPQSIAARTASAVIRNVSAAFEETGSFVADESSDIAPLVAGRVIRTPVNVGDWVKEGQIICELDHRDAELKLQQAKALFEEATASLRQAQSRIGWAGGTFDPNKVPEVAAARANYESAEAQARLAAADAKRYANLINTGDVSRSAYEKARTQQETAEAQASAAKQNYEAAQNTARQSYQVVATSEASLASVKAQLAQAEKGLADTTVRAPFEGFITARTVSVGEYVALTSKLVTIVRISTLKLQLQTPEQRAAGAKVGMSVVARVAAYPGRDFEGKVSAINPSVDPNSRVFVIEAKFQNTHAELRPGMFATARVLLPGGENGVFVPRRAVIHDKTTDSNQIYVVENGRARLRVVLIGDANGDETRILNGLSGNERVVTSNQQALYDGAPVAAKS
jgi:multidrug efflux pump subunit AcrA (membrane-fusion protein)